MTGNCGFPPSQKILQLLIATALVSSILTVPCLGQQTSEAALNALPSAPSASDGTPAPDNTRITIPPGTSIPLVLTRPLNSNDVHSGDAVFAQVSNPVMVGDEVAIPAGTFVRGKVDKLARNGTRADMLMHSASLVMGSSTVDAGGPVKIESEEYTAYNNPQGRKKAAIILAPLLGSGLGMAIGAAADRPHTITLGGGFSVPSGGIGGLPGPLQPVPPMTVTENSHTGLFVGSAVGGAVGLVTSLTLIGRSKEFYLEEGSPLHMALPSAVSVTRAQISDAQQSSSPVQVIRRSHPWPGPGNNPPIGFPGSTPTSGPSSCSPGEEWCMGSCKSNIDFISDNNNCGRCGNSCSIGESCTGGSCSCAPGYSSCMGSCVSSSSFISDNNNCGSCGHSCSIGESCTGGSCMKMP